MSKKNRNKKKKEKIQKKIQEYSNSEIIENSKQDPAEENSKIIENEKDTIINLEEKNFIIKDLKKISLSLISLIAILVGVKILQNQTEIINIFGDWLIKILNIRTK